MITVVALLHKAGVVAERPAENQERERRLRRRAWIPDRPNRIAFHLFGEIQLMSGDIEHDNRHPIFRQCAGLVGTNHSDRAQCFDGRQFSDEGIVFQHALRAEGERDGDHRGQAFRHNGNGDRDGDQQHMADFVAAP